MLFGDLAATEEVDKPVNDSGNEGTVISALNNLVRSIGSSVESAPDLFGSAFNSKVTALQQRAMLSLVTMWTASLTTSGGSGEVALSAVEEAMRTAHKRGDHDAVARTLLLMYHVLQQKQLQSGDVDYGLEDLLLRCIHRFASLKSHSMVAEAALSLVALRARGPVLWSDHSRGDADETTDTLGIKWSVADLWTQIGVSLLGNSAIVSRVIVLPSGVLDSANDATPPTSTSATAVSQANRATNKEVQLDAYLSELHAEDQARLHLMAALTVCDIFRRMGQPLMADLACRRTLRQHSERASPEDLARVYTKLICLKVDTINFRLIDLNMNGAHW
eukprot:gene29649-36727_t